MMEWALSRMRPYLRKAPAVRNADVGQTLLDYHSSRRTLNDVHIVDVAIAHLAHLTNM